MSKTLCEALGMRFVEIQYDNLDTKEYKGSSDQSKYGKLGGRAFYDNKTEEQKKRMACSWRKKNSW